MTDQQKEWTEYYRKLFVHEDTPTWLDLSNEAVQAQSFALAIEAAGPIAGRRCLDVGCGHGQLSTALFGLRAAEVIGVDIVQDTITSCRAKYPYLRWECGSPADGTFTRSLGEFDISFAVEVLQYVDWRVALNNLWEGVRSGGRMVAIVPNSDNDIVRRTIDRFGGTFLPPNPVEIGEFVAGLSEVASWAYRGMDFQHDQRLLPYVALPWGTDGGSDGPANRIAVIVSKGHV